MSIWRKSAQKESRERGVARAALDAAPRDELIREALRALARHGHKDRLGVWLEADSNATLHDEIVAGFHGLVWDRGNRDTPQEWAHLSVEPPLPDESLLHGKTVEQDLESSPGNPILGLLAGLRYALWVPIEWKEQLKGIILWGSTGKLPDTSRHHVESVAAELALALGLEEQQKIARLRDADLRVVHRFLSRQSSDCSPETVLSDLVDSCTQRLSSEEGPGATFAVIGNLRPETEKSGDGFSVDFRWRSGDESWTRAIETEPLAGVWQRALRARRVTGSEPEIGRMPGSVARIIAFPLESEGQLFGVLVAGLPGNATSLATLDRLELRAGLAVSFLQQKRRKEEESKRAGWQDALLECISEPLLLLDAQGRIRAASRGARELTATASRTTGPRLARVPGRANLAEMFRTHQQTHVQKWLQAGLDRRAASHGVNPEPLRAELHSGVSVRLSFASSAQLQDEVILLEPLAAPELPGQVEIELQSVIEWLEEGVII